MHILLHTRQKPNMMKLPFIILAPKAFIGENTADINFANSAHVVG